MASGIMNAPETQNTDSKFKPQSLDSLDARIIQYKYALTKLKYFTIAVDKLLDKAASTPDYNNIILVHYITALAINLFAISDNAFGAKLIGLENFKIIKGSKGIISQVVTHVPYDMKDHTVAPLEELPTKTSSVSCLKSLKMMCLLCKEGYQKRLDNASRELNNADFENDLEYLFEKEFFNVEKDFDLSLSSRLFPEASVEYEVDNSLLNSEHYSEAALIDMDLKSLITITSEVQAMLDFLKPNISKYWSYKSLPASECEKQFKGVPFSSYSLHRVLFWSLRLNEIYFILRRFGRQIYLSNNNHLHDHNFLAALKNPSYFRKLLNDMDELFLATKKNGVLIATITRFIRLNSSHATSPKNVINFMGYINQSVVLIESELKSVKEFIHLWITGELSFRYSHGLPVDYLSKLNSVLETEKVVGTKISKTRSIPSATEKARGSPTPKSSPIPSEQTKTQKTNKLVEKSSLSKLAASPAPESRQSRKIDPEDSKQAFYLRENSSSNSLQSGSNTSTNSEKTKALTTTSGGRKRSDSQPLSFNAAATALKSSSPTPKRGSPISSPSGSIRRSSSISKQSSTGNISSPLSSRISPVKTHFESEEKSATPKLTANQKFQQHLIEASRSGVLVGKEKKTLHDVVFDPSNPSSVNLRKQAATQPKTTSSPREDRTVQELPQEQASNVTHLQRPTRSQVTKRNTQRNSAIFQVDPSDNQSITRSDTHSADNSEASSKSSHNQEAAPKKVRFTGVPEYTPAEDEPSSQSCRILKKFATFKSPLIKSLRGEEGKVLKHEVEAGSLAFQSSHGNVFNPIASAPSRLAKFKNRF